VGERDTGKEREREREEPKFLREGEIEMRDS
jgi:hypothetical protein